MTSKSVVLLSAALLLFAPGRNRAESPARKSPAEPHVLRLGGVAYSPDSVTVWRGIRHYFQKNGLPADFVLYSNYDALVQALRDGQVDIAWNTPLAHAKYHAQAGKSQTLVMRDVDCNYRCQLIVRKDAGIASLADLAGKTMVLGSCESAEATVLPIYFLKKAGVSFKQMKIVRLQKDVDRFGCPCSSPRFVFKALQQGRGDAGIIGERMWQGMKPADKEKFAVLWESPSFSHCVFTARADFDRALGARFTKLMLAMDSDDALTTEILRLEGCSRWVAGSQDGFTTLLQALRDPEAMNLAR